VVKQLTNHSNTLFFFFPFYTFLIHRCEIIGKGLQKENKGCKKFNKRVAKIEAKSISQFPIRNYFGRWNPTQKPAALPNSICHTVTLIEDCTRNRRIGTTNN
jgi:hypothetical protein